MTNPQLHNPQFDSRPFFLEGGPVGVLLSHGFTATCWEVRQFAEALHRRGYTVAGPLLPGHGTTPEELNRVPWQEWAAAGEQVYGRLAEKCRRVFVGGESMGGLVALYLASQHPQIAGVLAYAPGIKLTLSKLDILKLHLAAPVTTQVGRASLDRADVWQGYPGLPLKAAQQLLKFRQATEQRLAQVTCPLLVFQGRLDTSVQPGAGEFLFQHVRSTIKEQHWMEESSHVILLDKEMEKVVQITVEFMERV